MWINLLFEMPNDECVRHLCIEYVCVNVRVRRLLTIRDTRCWHLPYNICCYSIVLSIMCCAQYYSVSLSMFQSIWLCCDSWTHVRLRSQKWWWNASFYWILQFTVGRIGPKYYVLFSIRKHSSKSKCCSANYFRIDSRAFRHKHSTPIASKTKTHLVFFSPAFDFHLFHINGVTNLCGMPAITWKCHVWTICAFAMRFNSCKSFLNAFNQPISQIKCH